MRAKTEKTALKIVKNEKAELEPVNSMKAKTWASEE